ncbi:MAG TPA: VOC family protein [Sphingomonas sp.]|nr:VOC family protein [Sphingomonas sp.]
MSVAKAFDVAYVRFRAPDLDAMRAFLHDFGMVEAGSDGDRLYMRGYGTGPFIHSTERSDSAGFAGFGIWVNDEADLARIAAHDGVPVETLDGPGGGKVARLTDPDGFTVEVVAGQAKAAPLENHPREDWNQGGAYPRRGLLRRVERGPSHVQRLGHVVLGVSNFRCSEAWYKERFGLVTSDEIQPAPGVAIGAFMRCDRGDQPCDHHTIFLLERPVPPGFMHAAFEVADLDDLMAGHEHLKKTSREHFWGVGRHYLGSQVFDYWKDPWGHEIEHWTDGDQLVAADGGGIGSIPELMGVQWGMEMPPLPGTKEGE